MSLPSERSFSQSKPRKRKAPWLDCELNFCGPILQGKKPRGEGRELSPHRFLFSALTFLQGTFSLLIAGHKIKKYHPTKPVFERKQK